MPDMIHVRPARERRVAFARWAVAQQPKVRTASPDTFTVPPHLFVLAPEHILIGSLVDGHRYISPEERPSRRKPKPKPKPEGAQRELLGVAQPTALVPPAPTPRRPAGPPPSQPAEDPPAPRAAADAEPEDTKPTPSPEDTSRQDAGHDGSHACDRCSRTFGTARGRDTHRRHAHRDDEPDGES